MRTIVQYKGQIHTGTPAIHVTVEEAREFGAGEGQSERTHRQEDGGHVGNDDSIRRAAVSYANAFFVFEEPQRSEFMAAFTREMHS